jgi:hypothetical protein
MPEPRVSTKDLGLGLVFAAKKAAVRSAAFSRKPSRCFKTVEISSKARARRRAWARHRAKSNQRTAQISHREKEGEQLQDCDPREISVQSRRPARGR